MLELDFEPLAIITNPVVLPVTLLVLSLHLLELILCFDETGVQFAALLRFSLKVRRLLLSHVDTDLDAFPQRHVLVFQELVFLISMIAMLIARGFQIGLQSDDLGSELLILRLKFVRSPHILLMLLLLLLDSGLQPLLELAVLMLVIFALFKLRYQPLNLLRHRRHRLTVEESILDEQLLGRARQPQQPGLQRVEAIITHLHLRLQLLNLLEQLLLRLRIHSHGRSLPHRCRHRGVSHLVVCVATGAFSRTAARLLGLVILQSLLGCFLLGTFEVDSAQVALAYVVLLNEVAELLVEELANDAIVGDVSPLVAQLQALEFALCALQLGEKLGWGEASACSGLGAGVRLG